MSAGGRAVSVGGHEIMSDGRHPASASGHASELRRLAHPSQGAFTERNELDVTTRREDLIEVETAHGSGRLIIPA
jgi:hypothetical protein